MLCEKNIVKKSILCVPKNGRRGSLSVLCNSTVREPVLRRLRITPLVFCLRVIGNEILINLEKTTFSDLSVTLINLQGRTQEQV